MNMRPDPLADFRPSGKPCRAARMIAALPPRSGAVIASALDGDEVRYPTARIRHVLASHFNAHISDTTLREHRRGLCQCGTASANRTNTTQTERVGQR